MFSLKRYLVLTLISHSEYCTDNPAVPIYYIKSLYLHRPAEAERTAEGPLRHSRHRPRPCSDSTGRRTRVHAQAPLPVTDLTQKQTDADSPRETWTRLVAAAGFTSTRGQNEITAGKVLEAHRRPRNSSQCTRATCVPRIKSQQPPLLRRVSGP